MAKKTSNSNQEIINEITADVASKNYASARENAEQLVKTDNSNSSQNIFKAVKTLETNYQEVKKKFKLTLLLMFLVVSVAFTLGMTLQMIAVIKFEATTLLISVSCLFTILMLLMLRYMICTKHQRAEMKEAESDYLSYAEELSDN